VTPENVPEAFVQVMGCTVGDLMRWLPVALPGAAVACDAAAGRVDAAFGDGTLTLRWRELSVRRIALLELPRLEVKFEYAGLSPPRRYEVQRRFDLATQRGGG
jgi:hypothetical protein